jgi:Tol biopolymer transport system component
MNIGRRARAAAALPTAAAVAVTAVGLAVTHALGLPPVALLAGLPGAQALDYSLSRTGFAPLDDAYVRRTLGLAPLTSTASGPGRTADQSADAAGFVPESSAPDVAGQTLTHPFTNDDFDRAVVARSLPFSATTDTMGGSRQPGEPTSCSRTGGTAWYRYDATQSGPLFADTVGTGYADALGVFAGRSLGELKPVTCGSSLTGAAQAGFAVRRGTSYWFQIAGTLGGSGRTVFHLRRIGTTLQVDSAVSVKAPPALSSDGRWVAWSAPGSAETRGSRPCPVTQQGGWCEAIYLRDLARGTTRIVLSLHDGVTAPTGASSDGSAEHAYELSLSRGARYVAFASDDDQLVSGDNNRLTDVFVLDTVTGRVERDSVDSDGRQARLPASNAKLVDPLNSVGSIGPRISADGRYVVFSSDADNLVPGDTNGHQDVFRHDRLTGRTVRVSVEGNGQQLARATSLERYSRSMSADGRLVAFESHEYTPAIGEFCSPTCGRALVWDARTGRTRDFSPPPPPGVEVDVLAVAISDDGRWLAVATAWTQGTNLTQTLTRHIVYKIDVRTKRQVVVLAERAKSGSVATAGTSAALSHVDLSADGRYVAFDSYEGVTTGDTNGAKDVFVQDTLLGATNLLSMSPSGVPWATDSQAPQLSADGRTVSYLHDTNSGSLAGTNTLSHVYVHHSSVAGVP